MCSRFDREFKKPTSFSSWIVHRYGLNNREINLDDIKNNFFSLYNELERKIIK